MAVVVPTTGYARPGAPTATTSPNPNLLSYTLAGPLKWHGCNGDADGDCLNQFYEDDLAWIAAPMLFFDEGEECGFGQWAALPHYQVRPDTRNTGDVQDWQANDGQTKRVRLSYYFNWPLDCGHGFEGKHLGDSELIRVSLSSQDMRTWVVDEVEYNAHGSSYLRMGSWLKDRADELGSDYLTVAIEDDKHGSWWGRAVDDQDCAGSEDNYGWGAIDCFPGEDWQDAFAAGNFQWLDASRNIGEPPILGGQFNTSGFATGGSITADPTTADSYFGVFNLGAGAGSVREYWWNPPASGKYDNFCGYLCPDWDRKADGNCNDRVIDIDPNDQRTFSECPPGLQTKLDTTPFATFQVPLNSCLGAAEDGADPCSWSAVGECACDDHCVVRGDCCPDKQEVCPFDPNSCDGLCGNMSTIGGCGCDYECMERGDCCEDFEDRCPDEEPHVLQGTCSDACGFGHEECRCDHDCEARGDCCQDKGVECGYAVDRTPGSCNDFCGYEGGGCFCDDDCMDRGDCCRDFQDLC